MNPASQDQETADKFASSWLNVYAAGVYSEEQFLEWIAPWTLGEIADQSVLELGCGSGALLVHTLKGKPARLVGVDLGDSVRRARELLAGTAAVIEKADLTDHTDLLRRFGTFDRVYCIGVLHHLKEPRRGFESLLLLTRPGGRFHGWVYAREGNALVRFTVEPLRRLAHRLPWWVNKYALALPLAVPFFLYSQLCRALTRAPGAEQLLPMFRYMLWISRREFRFHHHVAFDQLVSPQTAFIPRATVEQWLADPRIEPGSSYVILRNGNGWKFGGRIRAL